MAERALLVAGAGIAGLAAAIALNARGHEVIVAEERQASDEAGAGIQLGPNALRALDALGLKEALAAEAHVPPGISIRASATGSEITALPLGADAGARFGAPYWTLARQDLHRVLADRALARGITVERGFRIAAVEDDGGTVRLRTADGRTLAGRLLVGADGVWSAVRGSVLGEPPPRFTGHVAWRTMIDRSIADEAFSGDSVALWLGSSAHLVHYPVARGQKVNIVAVISGRPAAKGWGEPGDPSELRRAFAGWAPAVRRLIGNATGWRCWSLHERSASLPACRGRTVLIGDAAHPVLPFLAQGAALALEDAVALAADPDPERLVLSRRARWIRVQAQSRRNGRLYHLAGPMAAARDAVLRLTPPRMLIARYDWLYGDGREEDV